MTSANFKAICLTRPGFKPAISEFPDLRKREPPRLVTIYIKATVCHYSTTTHTAGSTTTHTAGVHINQTHGYGPVCWGFTSWQHLRPYQKENWLAIVHTQYDFIVLPPLAWESTLLAHWPNFPLSHIILILSKPTPCIIQVMPSARLGSDKYKFGKPLVWLDPGIKLPTFHMGSLRATDSATASSTGLQDNK